MSNMNFNTSNATFRQLFGNGLMYRVPPFQRDYSWTDDEWDDLWKDIVALVDSKDDQSHYMGYLVLQSSNNKQFDIIDGQQRLTTISVMILSALSHLQDLIKNGIDSERNQKRVEYLKSSYIGYIDPVSLVPQSKLRLNRHNDRFYQSYLVALDTIPQRGLNSSEHQLRKAFYWFKDKIKEKTKQSGESIASFVDSIVDKLFFTVITVSDELNAFKVFETLNARGVRLSATDLLKNYLFSIINAENPHPTEIDSLEDRWERIVGELGGESFPEFLRAFWNSTNKLVRKTDLFKTIQRKIRNKQQAFALIRDLDRASSTYAALRDPHDELWNEKEKKCIAQLQMFNVRQPLPMLLACFEKFSESKREIFTRVLASVSVISFRYNVICNFQAHDQERVYNDVAFKISEGTITDIREIFKALAEIYPEDAVFKAAFKEKELRTTNSRNKKVVRYILFEIEKKVSGGDVDFESSQYNLEHILPENPGPDWTHIEESNQDKYIYRIGNMTPLETTINRNLGNLGYETKKREYEKSHFDITKNISKHYDELTEAKIESRQLQLANHALAIWRVDIS